MKISEWGEEALIGWLKTQFPTSANTIGIGDDCAVIPPSPLCAGLVTTDALVENIHFLKEYISPRDLGYKLIAVNLSDIAAMGGRPLYCFSTIAIPGRTESEWIEALFHGMQEACAESGVSLLGGDITGSSETIFLNVTMMGEAVQSQVKYRKGAKLDDLICLTGTLGDSAAGLKSLLENVPSEPRIDTLVLAHCHPRAHLREGLWLGSQAAVHAMMDLSDGLHLDLNRILNLCGLGANINIDRLPFSEPLRQTCQRLSWDLPQLAITGGEDYCLMCMVDPAGYEQMNQEFLQIFHRPLYCVGQITDSPPGIRYMEEGIEAALNLKPYDHFFH